MININFNGIKNSYGSVGLMNFIFNFKKVNLLKSNKNENEFDSGKHHLISNYSSFCSLPDFEVQNPTMNKLLIRSFYDVVIKLTKDFEFTVSQFDYYKKNFLAINARNKLELIEFLIVERENIKPNDSRYYLGFRSIFFVLNNNSEIVNYEYLEGINNMLEPFFSSFKHKELLTFGLSFKEK